VAPRDGMPHGTRERERKGGPGMALVRQEAAQSTARHLL
jgi:hypothetical protein